MPKNQRCDIPQKCRIESSMCPSNTMGIIPAYGILDMFDGCLESFDSFGKRLGYFFYTGGQHRTVERRQAINAKLRSRQG